MGQYVRAHINGLVCICFAERREPIALRCPWFAQTRGNRPWLPVERMRSTPGGCGKNLLFFPLRETDTDQAAAARGIALAVERTGQIRQPKYTQDHRCPDQHRHDCKPIKHLRDCNPTPPPQPKCWICTEAHEWKVDHIEILRRVRGEPWHSQRTEEGNGKEPYRQEAAPVTLAVDNLASRAIFDAFLSSNQSEAGLR
jgi:hypothetical protein